MKPSDFLRKLRDDKGLTLEKISKEIAIPASTISTWERGAALPKGRNLRKICEFYGISSDRLLNPSNVRPAPKLKGLRRVPVVASMRAGFLDNIAADYEDIASQIDEMIETDCQDQNAFALIVEGDSMQPRFFAGDRVVIAPNYEPRNGDPVCARLEKDGKTVFKIYRQSGDTVRLESLNPDYGPEEFHKEAFRWIYPAVDLKAKLRR
jgi:SOS-response transcriptional repressor LexA